MRGLRAFVYAVNYDSMGSFHYLVHVELGQQQVGFLEVLSVVPAQLHLGHALQQIASLVLAIEEIER
jgi:hypothetical protein